MTLTKHKHFHLGDPFDLSNYYSSCSFSLQEVSSNVDLHIVKLLSQSNNFYHTFKQIIYSIGLTEGYMGHISASFQGLCLRIL